MRYGATARCGLPASCNKFRPCSSAGQSAVFVKRMSRWTWNGSVDKPTFTPSMNISAGPYKDADFDIPLSRCHYILTNGVINFCNDSTHALKGQQGVPLPDLPSELKD